MRPLSEIAKDILADWKKPSVHAMPYIVAMHSLQSVKDRFGVEDGEEIVIRFLSNAMGWRGPVAQIIKLELKGLLK